MQFDESKVPSIIKDALLGDVNRDEGDRTFEYSATVLCKSPRQVQLERRHKSEIATPALENVWYSFAGTAMHDYLEHRLMNNKRYLVEKRIIRFDKPSPDAPESDYRRVGAKFDAYDKETKTLSDHKTTTTFVHGKEMKPEWIKQLMINAYFLEMEGYPVERMAINAIYMDWRGSKLKYAKSEEDYPTAPCCEFSMAAPSMEERETLYKSLLKEHIAAESTPDHELPMCSPEYCWESGGSYAVYKEGAARALRLCPSLDAAQAYIKMKGIYGAKIEERKPIRRRCADYCAAAPFCNQYQMWLTEYNPTPTISDGDDCQSENPEETTSI